MDHLWINHGLFIMDGFLAIDGWLMDASWHFMVWISPETGLAVNLVWRDS